MNLSTIGDQLDFQIRTLMALDCKSDEFNAAEVVRETQYVHIGEGGR